MLIFAITFPDNESRIYKRFDLPDSSLAFTKLSLLSLSIIVTLVPAVMYNPASTIQSSPKEIPIPELAPKRQF